MKKKMSSRAHFFSLTPFCIQFNFNWTLDLVSLLGVTFDNNRGSLF